jgi:hypothetical protein
MNRILTTLTLLLPLMCAGCLSLYFSRAPNAAPGQWEYLTVRPEASPMMFTGTGGAEPDPQLTHLGQQGWELVALQDGAYLLKRPKRQ